MRVVATSDTHQKHGALFVPDGDVFIHAGDFTMIGDFEFVQSFNTWLGRLPHKHKIVIAGNHDRSFDIDPANALAYGAEQLTNATYLLNSGVELEGKKFWGSPYTPFFASDFWKFSYDRAEGSKIWDQIPDNLDVLITHGPPLYHLDRTLENDNAGCYDLFKRIRDMHETNTQPRYHIFGHIHEAYGADDKGADSGVTRMINVSAVDRQYNLRDRPCVVFNI
jgi:Icc-related predicted phosphoesterase